jgi:hypothetical protein
MTIKLNEIDFNVNSFLWVGAIKELNNAGKYFRIQTTDDFLDIMDFGKSERFSNIIVEDIEFTRALIIKAMNT